MKKLFALLLSISILSCSVQPAYAARIENHWTLNHPITSNNQKYSQLAIVTDYVPDRINLEISGSGGSQETGYLPIWGSCLLKSGSLYFCTINTAKGSFNAVVDVGGMLNQVVGQTALLDGTGNPIGTTITLFTLTYQAPAK